MMARREAADFGPRFVAPLLVGLMLNPLNSTMIATALVAIGETYAADAAATAWLIAGLYLASAIAQPVMGKIADRYGPRRVYLGGLILVSFAALAGAIAPTLGMLVLVRVLFGVGTSAAYPSAMAMVRAQSERTGQAPPGRVLGALTIAGQVSAVVGPALGGLLVAFAGWRAIFLVNLPLTLAGLAMTWAWLPADRPPRATQQQGETLWRALDAPGIAGFGLAMTLLLLFMMDLRTPNWPLLAAFAVVAVAFVIWELRVLRPFLDLGMLSRNPLLVRTYIRTVPTFLVIYGTLFGFAQWLGATRGLDAAMTGLILLPMSVVGVFGSMLGSRGRAVRWPLVAGAASMLAVAAALVVLDAQTSIVMLIAASLLFGIPQGLCPVGNQAALYAQSPADHVGSAAGLYRTAQYIGATLSSSLIAVVFAGRSGDAGLHALGLVFLAISAVLLVATALDRDLKR